MKHQPILRGGVSGDICAEDGQPWPCSGVAGQPLCCYCLSPACGGECVEP